jgi:hypothetical protein
MAESLLWRVSMLAIREEWPVGIALCGGWFGRLFSAEAIFDE